MSYETLNRFVLLMSICVVITATVGLVTTNRFLIEVSGWVVIGAAILSIYVGTRQSGVEGDP